VADNNLVSGMAGHHGQEVTEEVPCLIWVLYIFQLAAIIFFGA